MAHTRLRKVAFRSAVACLQWGGGGTGGGTRRRGDEGGGQRLLVFCHKEKEEKKTLVPPQIQTPQTRHTNLVHDRKIRSAQVDKVVPPVVPSQRRRHPEQTRQGQREAAPRDDPRRLKEPPIRRPPVSCWKIKSHHLSNMFHLSSFGFGGLVQWSCYCCVAFRF